jgi:[acyl-carrier-protein] S-malonyltransferase
MDETHTHGEGLGVPERMIVAPAVGVFRPSAGVGEGLALAAGQAVGHLEGPGTMTPVCSPFAGQLVGILAHAGERLREGQPVAWLRVA